MRNEPFEGTPPEVADGDLVEIQDANGDWHRTIAKSEPRYDHANAVGRRCWLSVAVVKPFTSSVVNWPAEDVRKVED